MSETAQATAMGRSPASSTAVRIMLSAMPVCTRTWPNQAPNTMITMVLAYCSPPFWRTLVRRSQKDEPASSGHAMASRSSTMMGLTPRKMTKTAMRKASIMTTPRNTLMVAS
jgi:hypothetical protein